MSEKEDEAVSVCCESVSVGNGEEEEVRDEDEEVKLREGKIRETCQSASHLHTSRL